MLGSGRASSAPAAPGDEFFGDLSTPMDVSEEGLARGLDGRGIFIAIVVDDLGRELGQVRRLHAMGVPITYAVLPWEVRTTEVATLLEQLGAETIVHLPMEASGPQNPGEGALLTGMAPDEIRRRTAAALDRVDNAVGVNNHMGSAFSEQGRLMKPVLETLALRHLFFLDSRTSAATTGFEIARELGIPAAQRTVFLDNDDSEAAIRAQFRELLVQGQRQGSAIAIGHPYESTLSVLERAIPRARAAGFQFVAVSKLLEG